MEKRGGGGCKASRKRKEISTHERALKCYWETVLNGSLDEGATFYMRGAMSWICIDFPQILNNTSGVQVV